MTESVELRLYRLAFELTRETVAYVWRGPVFEAPIATDFVGRPSHPGIERTWVVRVSAPTANQEHIEQGATPAEAIDRGLRYLVYKIGVPPALAVQMQALGIRA